MEKSESARMSNLLSDSVEGFLAAIGEDPTRSGLLGTPSRVSRMWCEFLAPPVFEMTVFDSDGYDEMVMQGGIRFYSFCEHHLLPFFGDVCVAYIPSHRLVGISKLARCVEWYSRRLQVQERMTAQIAEHLMKELEPLGVGVVVRARHLCQEMRGVRKPELWTVTSALRGVMLTKPEARAEFLELCKAQW